MSSLVLWCSGYHICFTRRRSPVRPWAGSEFFVTTTPRKYQDQYWIVFNISKLSYSAHLCHPKLALPHHKHYRGSVSPDVSARHYPAVLSHTHRDRVAYNVPILVGTGSPVWKEILLRYSSGKCLHSLLVPISGSRSQEFGWENIKSSIV